MVGVKKLHDALSADFPNLVFLLQPPNPIYASRYYIDHVNELKQLANEENILYIDHWQNWSHPSERFILNDLEGDGRWPDETENELWAEYLARYFTSQPTGK